MHGQNDRKLVYLPDAALLGVVVTVESWFLTVYRYLAKQDPLKQGVCTALSVIATIFLATVGRKAMRGRWPPPDGQEALDPLQIVWVTVVFLAFAAFHCWMLND